MYQNLKKIGDGYVVAANLKYALVIYTGNGYFYIGVQEVPLQHSWVYLSSGEPVETADWGAGEPDPLQNENCVLIAEKPTNMGHWADVECNRMEHFVCQKRSVFPFFTYHYHFH